MRNYNTGKYFQELPSNDVNLLSKKIKVIDIELIQKKYNCVRIFYSYAQNVRGQQITSIYTSMCYLS